MDHRHLFLIALTVIVLSAGCASHSARSVDPMSDQDARGPVDVQGAADVLLRLVAAESAQVRQRLSLVVPDEVGASTYVELDARFDLGDDRFEGSLDTWADEGEEGPMTTWPDDVPTDSTVRIVDDSIFMRWGGDDDGHAWHDVTSLGDLPPSVNHLESVRPLAMLLAEAVERRPPTVAPGATAIWRGTVPPDLLEPWVGHPGPIGAVGRFAAGMPSAAIDDAHVFEVEERGDGSVRISLWLDMSRLGADVGDEIPEGELVTRVDAQWSALGEPVTIVVPESVADLNQP